MKKFLFLLFMLCCSAAAFAQSTVSDIQKRGVLRVGMEVGYIPFEMEDKAGNVIGFDPAIAESFAQSLGVTVQYVLTPFDDLFKDLNTGKFDILLSGMTITSERKTQADFSTPYFASGQAMLVSKSKQNQIKSFRDINRPDVHIVTKQGTTAASLIETFFKKAKITLLDGAEERSLQMVSDGKADVMIYDMPYLAAAYTTLHDKLVFIPDPFTYEPFGAAVKKGNTSLRDAMNRHLTTIKENGDYDRIFNYWINSNQWQQELP